MVEKTEVPKTAEKVLAVGDANGNLLIPDYDMAILAR